MQNNSNAQARPEVVLIDLAAQKAVNTYLELAEELRAEGEHEQASVELHLARSCAANEYAKIWGQDDVRAGDLVYATVERGRSKFSARSRDEWRVAARADKKAVTTSDGEKIPYHRIKAVAAALPANTPEKDRPRGGAQAG